MHDSESVIAIKKEFIASISIWFYDHMRHEGF